MYYGAPRLIDLIDSKEGESGDWQDKIKNMFGFKKDKWNKKVFEMTPAEEIDFYYKWLCGKYAKDYVKQLIRLGEERDGIKIRYRTSDRLTFDNLDSFIRLL